MDVDDDEFLKDEHFSEIQIKEELYKQEECVAPENAKLLQKNRQYQKSLVQFKEFLIAKIARKKKQIQTLNSILQTIPNQEEEIEFKEKCSAYLSLGILHDSRQRKIFQFNITDFEILKQENPPHYIKLIQDLKKKDLKMKKMDYTSPRFRQQCKKKAKSLTLTQVIQPKSTQIRDQVIREVVNCLPIQGNQIDWALIPAHATQLLNIYTSDQNSIEPIEIYRCWLKKNHQLYSNVFTVAEDNELMRLVQLAGDNQWAYLAKLITTKTSISLRERWFKFLNKNIKRQRWTILEDLKLIILVDYFGVGQWNKLHQFFKNRTEVQIRERWCNVLDPELEVRPWTTEEDEELLKLHETYGNAWSVVSLKLKRTDNECRRRFQQIKK